MSKFAQKKMEEQDAKESLAWQQAPGKLGITVLIRRNSIRPTNHKFMFMLIMLWRPLSKLSMQALLHPKKRLNSLSLIQAASFQSK
jgi:hypothetical protein